LIISSNLKGLFQAFIGLLEIQFLLIRAFNNYFEERTLKLLVKLALVGGFTALETRNQYSSLLGEVYLLLARF
jgi:hypothetical protein